MTLSVVVRSSAPKAWSTYGLGSRARHGVKLVVLDDVPLGPWVACDPCNMRTRVSTNGHIQLSADLGGPLLAGPLVASDEAARSLAIVDPVRLPSGSESSSVGGSRTLEMT